MPAVQAVPHGKGVFNFVNELLATRFTGYGSAQRTAASENFESLLCVYCGLDGHYADAGVKARRRIIGSIFPEKLVFAGYGFRTTWMNDAAELVFKLDKGFPEKENGQTRRISDLSI